MSEFKLISAYKPLGDQPNAIKSLSKGIKNGLKHQTLLGVTGSGKTFTMANVIKEVQKPTLVISHNKTLAAQLYEEFKEFFPDNAVEYFGKGHPRPPRAGHLLDDQVEERTDVAAVNRRVMRRRNRPCPMRRCTKIELLLAGSQFDEGVEHLVEYLVGPGVGPVHLVDHHDRPDVACKRLAEHELGLGHRPSKASTSTSAPSAIWSVRSTSPPKSACPGVSIRLIFVGP